MQGSLGESRPAATAGEKADIEYEEDGKQNFGHRHGNGCADKAPAKALSLISPELDIRNHWGKEIATLGKDTQTNSQFKKAFRGAHMRRTYSEAENKP